MIVLCNALDDGKFLEFLGRTLRGSPHIREFIANAGVESGPRKPKCLMQRGPRPAAPVNRKIIAGDLCVKSMGYGVWSAEMTVIEDSGEINLYNAAHNTPYALQDFQTSSLQVYRKSQQEY